MKSINQKITKSRKPRVHITYDVEGSDGEKKIELPFVVGVMGDYSGHNKDNLKPLKERQFVEIDGENFDKVMTKIEPGLNLKIDNLLSEEDTSLAVDLKFNSMQDFEPDNVAKQVPALNKLLETRKLLIELLSKADRSEELESILENVLQDNEKLQELFKKLSDNKQEASNNG